ncbi:hypothetical protein [Brevundimonas diminuta]|uniref:hypothetical protein n=1 Tax=Brevundimonas diminuta TaxID=293 RepID=UPI0025A4EEE9|nr:hypothetical protein [Brevundimonas diminuta]MDM8354000.1 hypothetical protein [Brevundimonas diminuta]
MTSQIRQHADTVSEHFAITPYLVNYRISSSGDGAGRGDRADRYDALCEALKPMAGSSFKNFEDGGHHSTSSWIINVSKTAEQVGAELERLLVKGHDFLAIFEIADGNRWSMPDEDGDRAQTVRI